MVSIDAGSVQPYEVAVLKLDPMNPRLPPEAQGLSQEEIAVFINRHYDPVKIADSIARHQFFQSEPLIALRRDGDLVVIEGNRRLTALKALADPRLLEKFAQENSAWSNLRELVGPEVVPVLVVEDADTVAPLLGFRHISGIEPWDPYAQARYIAGLVEDGKSLDEIADLVGRSPTEVKSKYRDFDVLEQAESVFGIDTKRARKSFGVFNNAMGRVAIRAYIGAPDPRNVDPESYPLALEAKEPVRNLLRIIFGDSTPNSRVINDSRSLGDLAKVLAEPTGVALGVLLETGDLSEALDAMYDADERVEKAVRAAHRRLKGALTVSGYSISESTKVLLGQIESMATTLVGAAGEGGEQ